MSIEVRTFIKIKQFELKCKNFFFQIIIFMILYFQKIEGKGKIVELYSMLKLEKINKTRSVKSKKERSAKNVILSKHKDSDSPSLNAYLISLKNY